MNIYEMKDLFVKMSLTLSKAMIHGHQESDAHQLDLDTDDGADSSVQELIGRLASCAKEIKLIELDFQSTDPISFFDNPLHEGLVQDRTKLLQHAFYDLLSVFSHEVGYDEVTQAFELDENEPAELKSRSLLQ